MKHLIYIGRGFYAASGTRMGAYYTEAGARADIGTIETALEHGESVTIRPATALELERYRARLGDLLAQQVLERAKEGS